ncbi:hypothetical protein D9M70_620640 [compost metagenome]
MAERYAVAAVEDFLEGVKRAGTDIAVDHSGSGHDKADCRRMMVVFLMVLGRTGRCIGHLLCFPPGKIRRIPLRQSCRCKSRASLFPITIEGDFAADRRADCPLDTGQARGLPVELRTF